MTDPSILMIFSEHCIFPHTHIPVNLSCLSWAEKEKDRRQKSRSASGDILPCRHCNLLYKLHVSSAARLKTTSSVYQSPVNCWVNFPLTLVLWFITLLKIWHCQSKCSGQAFSHCPVFLLLIVHAQFTQKKRCYVDHCYFQLFIYSERSMCMFKLLPNCSQKCCLKSQIPLSNIAFDMFCLRVGGLPSSQFFSSFFFQDLWNRRVERLTSH